MFPRWFAPFLLAVFFPACVGRLPQAADTQTARPQRGHGNAGLRRSEDVSGLPIPPGPGDVARPAKDEDTRALQALNDKLHRDERIDVAMLPIGDGLTLARKR